LSETSETLNQLVEYLVSEKKGSENAITQILTINHPLFKEIERAAEIPFRIFFENLKELLAMFHKLDFKIIQKGQFGVEDGYVSWFFPNSTNDVIRISKEMFDDINDDTPLSECKLKMMTVGYWKAYYVKIDSVIPF